MESQRSNKERNKLIKDGKGIGIEIVFNTK